MRSPKTLGISNEHRPPFYSLNTTLCTSKCSVHAVLLPRVKRRAMTRVDPLCCVSGPPLCRLSRREVALCAPPFPLCRRVRTQTSRRRQIRVSSQRSPVPTVCGSLEQPRTRERRLSGSQEKRVFRCGSRVFAVSRQGVLILQQRPVRRTGGRLPHTRDASVFVVCHVRLWTSVFSHGRLSGVCGVTHPSATTSLCSVYCNTLI